MGDGKQRPVLVLPPNAVEKAILKHPSIGIETLNIKDFKGMFLIKKTEVQELTDKIKGFRGVETVRRSSANIGGLVSGTSNLFL